MKRVKCDKTQRDRDELIDRYIRNELSDQEVAYFEEHLLLCTTCRNELAKREKILSDLQRFWTREVFKGSGQNRSFSKKRLYRYAYVAAAAGVVLVIGLFLIPNRHAPNRSSQHEIEGIQSDTTKAPRPSEVDVIIPEDSEMRLSSISQSDLTDLEEYQANPLYENLIGINLRSGNLLVESPADSFQCISGTGVEFKYGGAETDSLFLAILNNRGEIISEDKIASPHILFMELSNGLYYWQFTNEDEALHTGKMYILSN